MDLLFLKHFKWSLYFLMALVLWGCKQKEPQNQAATSSTTGNPVIDQLSQEITRNPNDPTLYFKRAEQYYEYDGFDEAIQDLQKALSMDSTNADYLHLLADVYLDYFRSRDALRTMEKAARLHPARIPTLLKLSEFQLLLKQYEASLKTVDGILQQDPQNAEAYFMMGMNFKETGDTARAINSFQTAVENDPDLVDAWINLGQLQAALGHAIAGQYFDSALRVAPDNIQALHAKAYYLQSRNDLKGAIRLFKKISQIDPQYAEAYYNAGLLYLDLDSIPQAYRQFDLAIQTDPVHIRAYFYRGIAAEMQGRVDQARQDYQQALKLAPDYENARKALEELNAAKQQ